jgi:hypothetical protein
MAFNSRTGGDIVRECARDGFTNLVTDCKTLLRKSCENYMQKIPDIGAEDRIKQRYPSSDTKTSKRKSSDTNTEQESKRAKQGDTDKKDPGAKDASVN